jgi:phosphoglycolate phosphatase-like HAD superfamily hydrolase
MPVFLSQEELDRRGDAIEAYRTDLFKTRYQPQVRAFSAVRQLFERVLANGQQIALASSAKADELATYKKIADIADLVDEETSSDDAERSKPHPDIFEAALSRLGDLDPGEGMVVGDAPYDAEAAGKIGLRTIGVLCGGFPEHDLQGAGCIAIYRDPADLLARFEQSPLALEGPPRQTRCNAHRLLIVLGLAAGAAVALAIHLRRA